MGVTVFNRPVYRFTFQPSFTFDDDLIQEDNQNDGFDVEYAFFTGGLFGFAYEEGKQERRKRRSPGSDDSSDIG